MNSKIEKIKDSLGEEHYIVKEKVTLKVVDTTHLPGQDIKDYVIKVGSSMGIGNKSNTGLSLEEEIKFLPTLIKTKPSSEHWEEAVENYAADISFTPNPVTGSPLNISMRFKVESDAKKYANRHENLPKDRLKKDYHESYLKVITQSFNGFPVNVKDYCLWRYLLVYRRVANEPELVTKARHIQFVLIDENREAAKRANSAANKAEAYSKLYSLVNDTKKQRAILRLTGLSSDVSLAEIRETSVISLIDEDKLFIELEAVVKERPNLFLTYMKEDYDTEMASFILECIELDILEFIPNTETIREVGKDNRIIGKGVEAASNFLSNENNKEASLILKELEVMYDARKKS